MNANRPDSVARVRLYQHGLGECTLVTLVSSDGRRSTVLIDCGLPQGVERLGPRLEAVAADIAQESCGRLDLVIVTQAGWDHVSGFVLAERTFEKLSVGEVWLPWTEHPQHADSIQEPRAQAARSLWILANRARSGQDACSTQARGLVALAGMLGPASGPTLRDAMDVLRNHRSSPIVRYVGQAPASWSAGCRTDPHVVLACPVEAALPAAPRVPGLIDSDPGAGRPFDNRYFVPAEDAETTPFFQVNYLASKLAWRRLDPSPISSTQAFAMSLDRWSSQASLTLSIELEPDGRLLLFPGDRPASAWAADLGARKDSGGPPSASPWSARTVLWKIGRSGGPGALPPSQVLDAFQDPDLRIWLACSRLDSTRLGWSLPAPSVVKSLASRFPGRVLGCEEGTFLAKLGDGRGCRVEANQDKKYVDVIYPVASCIGSCE